MIDHELRFNPTRMRIAELIHGGELGEIRVVNVEYAQDWLTEDLESTGQKQAGWRTDPPVSDPRDAAAIPAATAAAEPPLDPPATRSRAHGFRTGPAADCSLEEPIPNSSRFVFPTSTAPAARRRATAVASMH